MDYKAFCALRSQFENVASQLTDAFQETGKPVKADFPRGFIRPLKDHYKRWPYLDKERKRTVACLIQLCDVNRWNLNIWEIGLTAGALLEWYVTVPVVAVIETLAYEVCIQSGWAKGNQQISSKSA